MFKKSHFMVLVLIVSVVVSMLSFPAVYAETISGRLVSTFDGQTGKATLFFAGYSKDQPVVIGPSTKPITAEVFAGCTKDGIGRMFSEQNLVITRVTKFKNNGRQIMAEIVMER